MNATHYKNLRDKFHYAINMGADPVAFIKNYIETKTPSTFRVIDKKTREMIAEALDNRFIDDEQYAQMIDALKTKREKKNLSLAIQINEMFKDFYNYQKLDALTQEQTIVSFVSIFIDKIAIANVSSIKYSDIKYVEDEENEKLIIKWKDDKDTVVLSTAVKYVAFFKKLIDTYQNDDSFIFEPFIVDKDAEKIKLRHSVLNNMIRRNIKTYAVSGADITLSGYLKALKDSIQNKDSTILR